MMKSTQSEPICDYLIPSEPNRTKKEENRSIGLYFDVCRILVQHLELYQQHNLESEGFFT